MCSVRVGQVLGPWNQSGYRQKNCSTAPQWKDVHGRCPVPLLLTSKEEVILQSRVLLLHAHEARPRYVRNTSRSENIAHILRVMTFFGRGLSNVSRDAIQESSRTECCESSSAQTRRVGRQRVPDLVIRDTCKHFRNSPIFRLTGKSPAKGQTSRTKNRALSISIAMGLKTPSQQQL